MLADAKYRAVKQGVPFRLKLKDIKIPNFCPILGIPLECVAGGSAASPSLDRIEPHKGYVPGNVQVISWRANQLKRDASLQELKMLGLFAIRELERME